MTTAEIIQAILNGDVDGDFNEINSALRERQKYAAKIRSAAFTIGTRVKLANVRPKYLVGLIGTVTGTQGQKFIVELDAGQNTRRYSTTLPCKATILELA